jgi:hypothetical protein
MEMIMKKVLSLTSAVALSVLLSACAAKQEVVKEAVPDCTFPDSPTVAAPGWVCDEPVPGIDVSAVGSADKSGAGNDFMKQQAAASARVQLAQNMKVQVTNMIKQYAETTGVGESETVDKVNTSVTKQITDETLMGSRIYKSRRSPAGTLYVLVGIDTKNFVSKTQDMLKTSMNNDKALWQQFKASKSQDELAADIAKIRAQ